MANRYRTPSSNIRLIFQTEQFATDSVRDFDSVSEAREAVKSEWFDWVIFERVNPMVAGVTGRVLDSI